MAQKNKYVVLEIKPDKSVWEIDSFDDLKFAELLADELIEDGRDVFVKTVLLES